MRLPFRRWRPSLLFLAWCAYWVGLGLVKLAPAIAAAFRLSQQPHGHGNVNVSFGNGGFSATIIDGARTVWTGSISVLSLALLIAVPPLLLWLVWLAAPARTNNADAMASTKDERHSELRAAGPRIGIIENSTSSTSKRRAREDS